MENYKVDKKLIAPSSMFYVSSSMIFHGSLIQIGHNKIECTVKLSDKIRKNSKVIKIIHTSDIHIGAKLNWLRERSESQRTQIMHTFEKIIDYAIIKKADLLCVAGDLFDTYSPSAISIAFVKTQLDKLAANNIYTIIIPGNHDRLEINSVLKENVLVKLGHCFNNTGAESCNIPGLDLNIFGFAIEKQFGNTRPLKEINLAFEKSKSAKFNIALVHGSLKIDNSPTTNYPIYPEDIAESKFDYIALGDWHGTLDATNTRLALYSGSPELISKAQFECGNLLYIEIDEPLAQGGKARVEQIRIGVRKSKEIKIDIDKYEANLNHGLNEGIMQELTQASDPNLIVSVELVGKRSAFENLDLEQLRLLLSEKFFFIEFKDSTRIKISEEDLAKYPEATLVGRYIKNIKTALEETENNDEKKILEEALFEGIQRILNSK